MSIQDYVVDHDKFEPAQEGLSKYDFPCCTCKHLWIDKIQNILRMNNEYPCSECGHNLAFGSDD